MEEYWSSNGNSGVTYTGIMGFGDTNTPNAAGLSSLVTMMQPQPLPPLLMQNHSSSSAADKEEETRTNMKAKIMAHPLFPRLLSAYANCQKVGAPPEVVARLEQATAYHINVAAMSTATSTSSTKRKVRGGDEDPELEQFMEAYCEMLIKYEEEITKPFKEAMIFISKIDSQLKALTLHSPSPSATSSGEKCVARSASSEEEDDVMNSESCIDPQAGDRELKVQLMRKYSGYLGSLKQEFSKKKKIEKLPKEARNQLLDWWSRHYKWPYPTETEKLALAELTGLDMKQINNWFINQRKRHWKPSEDMQFVPLDPDHHLPRYYMDHNNVFFPTDCASTRSYE